MPDLLRRIAVLALLSAVVIGLVAPLTARSATPLSVESEQLLAAADQAGARAARAVVEGRGRAAALSLNAVSPPIGPETLGVDPALANPPSADMQATLYRRGSKVSPPPASGTVLSGRATWYCCSKGWRGEAVVALPGALGGHYDAPPATRSVTVCADRCAVLPIVDYCGCLWGTSSQKVADLSPEAWAAISDTGLSRGVIRVTLRFD